MPSINDFVVPSEEEEKEKEKDNFIDEEGTDDNVVLVGEPYDYNISLMKFDMKWGSLDSYLMLNSLKDSVNDQILLTEVVQLYIEHHWRHSLWVILAYALWHIIFVVLLTA
jgi:hypothetical protein